MNVGILGAGQLGRMLALAGVPLGLKFRFLDPNPDSPAAALGPLTAAEFPDDAALEQFAAGLDVATFEFENVPARAIRALERRIPVHPSAAALEATQDRLSEKRLFEELGIPTTKYAPIGTRAEFDAALAAVGWPAVVKTRRLGYDGKGQAVVRSAGEVDAAWRALGEGKIPLLAEEFIPFDREISVIAVRSPAREFRAYAPVENRHDRGILRRSEAPAPSMSDELRESMVGAVRKVAERLGHVGVMTIEFFVRGGKAYANEIAPRVHNSGHWTIEGAETSQFENHLRAVCGLPLGSTACRGSSVMVNLIGAVPAREAVLAIPGAHLHDYGKEARHGRKVGHVTLTGAGDFGAREAALRGLLPDLG